MDTPSRKDYIFNFLLFLLFRLDGLKEQLVTPFRDLAVLTYGVTPLAHLYIGQGFGSKGSGGMGITYLVNQ